MKKKDIQMARNVLRRKKKRERERGNEWLVFERINMKKKRWKKRNKKEIKSDKGTKKIKGRGKQVNITWENKYKSQKIKRERKIEK